MLAFCAQTILNLAGAMIPTDRIIDGIDMVSRHTTLLEV